jgi:hypothetical protein
MIREFLAQLVATGSSMALDKPFSPAGFRLQLHRKRVRGTDEILAPFAIRAPVSVTHHLYASSVVCPDLPDADREALTDDVEAILFRYLNPLDAIFGKHRTLWVLSETEQNQLMRVMALTPEEEADYVLLAGPQAQWTGPTRGLHKTMANLAQMLSRHPDFATGKVVCKPPATFLFLADANGVERAPTLGITADGRGLPSRGIFALDTASYMDALVQLGEEEARGLGVVEFRFSGSCLRASGPLGIPLYRIPHAIPASSIVSVSMVAGNEILFPAATPVP